MAQKCEDHGSCWPSAMISTIFVSGGQQSAFDRAATELAHDDFGLGDEKRLFVKTEFVRLDRIKTEGFERLDHRRAIGDVSAV